MCRKVKKILEMIRTLLKQEYLQRCIVQMSPSFLSNTQPCSEICFRMIVTLHAETISVTSADFPARFTHL